MTTQPPCTLLELDEQPMGCDISPSAPLVATALINGQLVLHTYGFEAAAAHAGGTGTPAGAGRSQTLTTQLAHTVEAHAEGHSCRAVAFMHGGASLASGSSDHSLELRDSSTAALIRRVADAHEAEVSALFSPAPCLLASGDENGALKLWDTRTKKTVLHYKKHVDFISGFALHDKEHSLLACSGDGTMSVHELRSYKCRLRTEDDADDELLSVAVVKGGKKVVAGTQSGVLNIYSWGAMKDCSDRFPGHPESVDSVVRWDDDTVLTGSSDGVVRIISVQPNKLLGLVGEHSELPVECLALAQDRTVLASASHDHTVKLWDMSFLLGGEEDEEGEEEEEEDVEDVGEGEQGGALGTGLAGQRGEEQEEGSSSDREEDDGEGEGEEEEGEESQEGGGEGEGEEGTEDEAAAQASVARQAQLQGKAKKGAEEARATSGRAAGASKGRQQNSGIDAEREVSKEKQEEARGTSGRAARASKRQQQDSDDEGSDSDSEREGDKKKQKKGEKTRWQKEPKNRRKAGGATPASFFLDLLAE